MDRDWLGEKICAAGRDAVLRYYAVSDKDIDVPELFLASYMFHQLGHELTLTLETKSRRLLDHATVEGRDARTRMKGWRVDLVAYDKGSDGSQKRGQVSALVEVKKGWLSDERKDDQRSDLQKILTLMQAIETVKFGVLAAHVAEVEREKKEKKAKDRGDAWYQLRIPIERAQSLWFCVWMLERGKGSLFESRTTDPAYPSPPSK